MTTETTTKPNLQKYADRAMQRVKDHGIQAGIEYLRSNGDPGVLALVSHELAMAYQDWKEQQERAEEQTRIAMAERQAASKKRERENAEYRKAHPEEFVYVAVLKHNEDDRYCNEPVVLVARTYEEVQTQLEGYMRSDNDDEDNEEDSDNDDPWNEEEGPWQIIYESWEKL
jgi:hypothetical protein